MTRYLLDTNIVSDLMRAPTGRSFVRFKSVDQHGVHQHRRRGRAALFGASKKGFARIIREVEGILGRLPVVRLEQPVEQRYGIARAEMERRGTPIGANDLWIAAQALHDGSVLVTDKTREFGRVPGLAVENWLRP